MPEGTKDEALKGEQEAKELPVPTLSGDSDGAGSAGSGIDISALANQVKEQLSKDLPDLIDARFKSAKDKRFSRLDTYATEFEAMAKYLEDAGGDAAKAARNYKIDRMLEQEVSGGDPGRSAGQERQGEGRVPEETVQQSAMDILKKYDVPATHPSVAELAFKMNGATLDQYLSELDRVAKSLGSQQRHENIPPSAVQSEGTGLTTSDTYEALNKAYQQELSKLRPGQEYINGKQRLKDKYAAIAREKGIKLPTG